MLADEVVERTYSEWLERGGANMREFDTLSIAVADTTTLTWNLSGRLDEIPDGEIVECEYELARVDSQTGSVATLNERGYGESAPATHLIGTKVFVDPRWWRITLLNHLKAVLTQLYAWGAYKRSEDATEVVPATGMVSLAATVEEVLDVYVESNAGTEDWVPLVRGREWQFFNAFSPPKLRILAGIPGRSIQMTTKGDYDLSGWSNTGQTNLTTLGVPEGIQEHLSMAVAGYALRGAEVPRLMTDELKRMLAATGAQIQVGARLNIGQALIEGFKSTAVATEVMRLREKDRPRVEIVGVRG